MIAVAHAFFWLAMLGLFYEFVSWMVNKRGPM